MVDNVVHKSDTGVVDNRLIKNEDKDEDEGVIGIHDNDSILAIDLVI